MAISSAYPTTRPTLTLDFAKSKQVDPIVTFTRASTGTFVDQTGTLRTALVNRPRITHDPASGKCLGLLVEEARTNLLLRSEEFDNASWVKARASVSANATTAPDGTTTADRLTEDTTASNTHQVSQSYTFTATSHTINVFAKPDSRVRFRVVVSDGTTTFSSYYNLSSGVADNTLNGTAAMQQLANGWWRCLFTFTPVAAAGSVQFRLAPASGSEFYTGDGTSGLFLWGAQLEAGAFPTSYIPTTGTSANRAADIATITGSNFSKWYRQDEGSAYASGASYAGAVRWAGFNSTASFSEAIAFGNVIANNSELTVRTPTTTTAVSINVGTTNSNNTETRHACAFAANSFAVTKDGTTPATSSSGSLPVSRNRLYIGVSSDTFAYHNGTISRFYFWPSRLSNNNLQTLTTF